MPKRKQSGSAFDDFRKNVYPLLFKHAGDDLMEYHISLICHPSGELEVEEGNPLPFYLYKCVAAKKKDDDELSGYGNLIVHLDNKHEGWRDKVEEAYTSTTYNWMDLLITENLPLSYVEDKAFAVNGSRPS